MRNIRRKFVGVCLMAMALFVSTPSFAIDLDFGNVPEENARLVFDGNTDSFVFNTAAAGPFTGFAFRINGSDSVIADAVGLLGRIEGTFAIGPVMAFPGGGEMATVTSSPGARIRIQDGNGLWWEGDVDWVELITLGTGGFLNISGTINVTAVTYNGVNSDLLALKGAANRASAILAFTFNPAQSITQLKADGNIQRTSYEGDLVSEPCTGQIGNFVWQDLNGNGCQDPNEPGLAGVKVELYSGDCGAAGVKIGEVITTGTGAYLFSGLCPGNYQVKFTPPAGYLATLPLQNCAVNSGNLHSNQTDSKCNCVGGGLCTVCVTLTAATPMNLNVDCGYVQLARLGNFVWHDQNQDGKQDGNEPGIANVTVRLYKCDNTLVGTTTTADGTGSDPLGYYQFTGLIPGCYKVEFVKPCAYVFTLKNAIPPATPATDSDADPMTGFTGNVTLQPGESNQDVDAGLFCVPPVLSGLPGSMGPYQCRNLVPNPPAVTAVDNCNNPVAVNFQETQSAPGSSCHNTITRTWTATSPCGAIASFTQIIIVNDDVPPVITAMGTTLTLGCNPNAAMIEAALGSATAMDNCGRLTPIATTGGVVANGCNRSQTRTWNAMDTCGNAAAAVSRTVTWKVDTQAPVITAMGTTLTLGCNPTAAQIESALGTATAADNCDSVTPIATTGSVVANGCNRSQTRTWNAVDACGNPAVAVSRTVTWKVDTQGPVIAAMGTTLTLGCNPNAATIEAALGSATAADNCDAVTPVATTGSVVANGCNRSQTRTWNAMDACGNPAVAVSRTVTWKEDTTPPVLSGQGANATINCPALPVFTPPTATDTCDGSLPVMVVSDVTVPPNPASDVAYTRTVTWKAVDACGNQSATVSQSITVNPCLGPCVQIIKKAASSQALPFAPVVYSYLVTNCGGTTLTGLDVIDDHGTPNILGDDEFIGTIPSLAPGASVTLTKSLIPPVIICSTNTMVPSGMIIINILGNGNVRATFVQDFGVNDNTYGANAYGWSGGHTFNNLVGSDKAVWEFKNGAGQVVMAFAQDYISATNVSATYPSGYANLGFGGDGDPPTVGLVSDLVYSSSSLAENLNKAPFLANLAQYKVNSPASNDVNSAQWEYRMMYTVELKASVFGASGFGKASIIDQHNSPGKRSIVNPNPCSSCATNIATVVSSSGVNNSDDARVCVSTNPPLPQLQLIKTAGKTVVAPGGEDVIFTYTVINNGDETINNIVVVDDHGTPDTGDDVPVGTIVSLAAGASTTLTATIHVGPLMPTQPAELCQKINGVDVLVGLMTVEDLGTSIKVTYVQKNVNDNRYGSGANAATGWPNGQTFSKLTGSDKAEFRFTDANGNVVLDFFVDYISAANSATFPAPYNVISYPSGYGTLGVNGGDGSMVTGNAANVLLATTSLSENLRKAAFNAFQGPFTVNSPTETAPLSGVSIPAGWDYDNTYTVIVSKSAFGAIGFGGVTVPAVHDSPPKIGPSNLITPTNCNPCVVNVAVALGTIGATPITATASASVCFGTPGGSQACNIAPSVMKLDRKQLQLPLKNNGSADIFLNELFVKWPKAVNGNLVKVKLNGDVWGGALTVSPDTLDTAEFDAFNADTNRRKIAPGQTKTLVLEFANNVSKTVTDYVGTKIKFGTDPSCIIELK